MATEMTDESVIMSTSDHKPEDYGIRCSKCLKPYDCRLNYLNGKPTWFPNCKHDSAYGMVCLKSEF